MDSANDCVDSWISSGGGDNRLTKDWFRLQLRLQNII